jgi:hypothetical protein
MMKWRLLEYKMTVEVEISEDFNKLSNLQSALNTKTKGEGLMYLIEEVDEEDF